MVNNIAKVIASTPRHHHPSLPRPTRPRILFFLLCASDCLSHRLRHAPRGTSSSARPNHVRSAGPSQKQRLLEQERTQTPFVRPGKGPISTKLRQAGPGTVSGLAATLPEQCTHSIRASPGALQRESRPRLPLALDKIGIHSLLHGRPTATLTRSRMWCTYLFSSYTSNAGISVFLL